MKQLRGFSLVELLVAVAVGMLALAFATRLVAGSESNKQASVGGSDAMQNGMLAMFSMSNDAAQAGWGLNDPLVTGCDTVFRDSAGFALAPAARGTVSVTPLAAAVIVDGGSKSDSISMYAGSSTSGTGSMRLAADSTGQVLAVDRVPFGFAQGDAIVVVPETLGAARCTVATITSKPEDLPAPPDTQQVDVQSGGRYNGNSLGITYKGNQARLFNLGPSNKLAFHTWSVNKGFLRLRATDLAGAGGAAGSMVVDNIVSIKAQYGLDMRVGAAFLPEKGMVVSRWSATMPDADSDGVAGSAGDYQRIAALRLAVVARSRAPERPEPGKSCSATTVEPSVFASESIKDITAVPVKVDVAVDQDSVDWKCYRYRVFETIVPLRNSGWRPQA
jgi:type IV pilus assembly protein PilW